MNRYMITVVYRASGKINAKQTVLRRERGLDRQEGIRLFDEIVANLCKLNYKCGEWEADPSVTEGTIKRVRTRVSGKYASYTEVLLFGYEEIPFDLSKVKVYTVEG